MLARLTDLTWIPDLGLPAWCSSPEWMASVTREDGDGGIGRHKDREVAIEQAFRLSATWGLQDEQWGPQYRREAVHGT